MDNIVVTGIGVVCSIANNPDEYLCSLKQGKNGIDEITKYDCSSEEIQIAGQVKDLIFSDYMNIKSLREYGLVSKFGIVAARQAIENSNIKIKENEDQIAIISASALADVDSFMRYTEKLQKNTKYADVYNRLYTNDTISSSIAISLGIKGANFSVSCGCSSFSVAIMEAINLLKLRKYKYVLVCGAEAPINKNVLRSFNLSRLLTKTVIRPYDEMADGFALGEGAAAIVLELEENAVERNTSALCKVVSSGIYCDAFSIHSEPPTIGGKKKAVLRALEGIDLNDISYINSYGCGVKYIDKEEVDLISEVFKEKSKDISISSTKSMVGHMLGASAGVEIISVILSLKYKFLIPTMNIIHTKYNLDFVPNCSRESMCKKALKLSYSSGNKNTAIVFERV